MMNRSSIVFRIAFFSVLCFAGLSSALSGCKQVSEKVPGRNVAAVSDTGTAVMVFDEFEHDFGKVAEGEKVSYAFRFENRGTADLVIKSVTTSCGCTVPKYDRKPIGTGGKGTIEVVFDTSGREGQQSKTIVVSAGGKKPEIMLRISAFILTDNNK